MPAKSKLTPDIWKQILALAQGGVHPDRALAAVGLTSGTLRKWRMHARDGKRKYIERLAELETAVARCEANDIMTTRRAATVEKLPPRACKECGAMVEIDQYEALTMVRHVTAAQSIKTQAAAVAMQRLTLRFPKRWSPHVVHTVEEEHGRLLDVAQRLLAPEVFEQLLEAYLAEDSGSDETGDGSDEQGSESVH